MADERQQGRGCGGGGFEDLLPVMAEKLGGEGLIQELCNGFKLLMDKEKGVITLESLKRNAALLGLRGMRDEELKAMMQEGDVDGDGVLSDKEFCVLMFRLSPELMEASEYWLEQALDLEVKSTKKPSSSSFSSSTASS